MIVARRGTLARIVAAFVLLELTYHAAVRIIRKGHGNAVLGLLINIAQTLLLVLVFYLVFLFMGMGARGIRGDLLLFVLTRVFLFMLHVKTVSAVVQSEGPTSPMMKHAPMNTYVAIGAAAFATLYIQVLSMLVLLFLYHALWTPIAIHDPFGALLMLGLGWLAGVALGVLLLGLKPWAPNVASFITQLYSRVSMFTSGKMFVANALPGFLLPYFDWNPLFHIVDQARGFTFLNYSPQHSSTAYALWVSVAVLIVGLMAEAFARRNASLSWGAAR